MKTLLWFRRDFRLEDNSALAEASKDQVLPVYIHAPSKSAASDWYLHHALSHFQKKLNGKLVILTGEPKKVLTKLISEHKINKVVWNRLYEPDLVKRDTEIKSDLKKAEIEVKSFSGHLLMEPFKAFNSTGKPYQVFTPYWKYLLTQYQHTAPLKAPKKIDFIDAQGLSIEELKLLPKLDWADGFGEYWNWGLSKENFNPARYKELRDFPAISATSRLSPALHFGELSPRMIWDKYLEGRGFNSVEPYLRQLGWRDFAHHLLFHFPHTVSKPMRADFEKFPWKKNKKYLLAWQQGRTGYPIVDAGMRELWKTGWMHNRVRMIVGSFLVKNLLQPWQDGAEWFWDTLVDADLANNTMGWQWIAGCGADAAPYFRVFNPVLQGEKFDAEGEYVKKWVPELREVPAKWIHKIWEAPEEIAKLAKKYPKPIVDLAESRDSALDAYSRLKESR